MSAQEFKVGQTVSGDDFAYLPRGTVVSGPGVPTRRKDALGMWVARDGGFPFAVPDKGMAMSRTITHLPAPEPEDTDDADPAPLPAPGIGARPPYSVTFIDPRVVGGGTRQWHVMGTVDGTPGNPQGPIAVCEYEPSAHTLAKMLNEAAERAAENTDDVEPEPLKEGAHALAWVEVVEVDTDGEVLVLIRDTGAFTNGHTARLWIDDDAIVRPDAGQVPPWVKPARCTSLVMADKTTNLRQCVRPEDGHDEHAAYGVVWTDAEAYGRVEVRS